MTTIESLTDFAVIFIITFIVSALVTFLYSLIIHSEGIFDWGLAFILSITFGIIFALINSREREKSKIH